VSDKKGEDGNTYSLSHDELFERVRRRELEPFFREEFLRFSSSWDTGR